MSKLKLDQLSAGMVLGEEVKSKAGRLLLGQGMELTEKHLLIFRTWGVQEVTIVTESDEQQHDSKTDAAEISIEQLEKATEELRPIFSQVDLDHPLFAELLHLAAQKRALTHD